MNELFDLSSQEAVMGREWGNVVRGIIHGRSASDNTLSAVIGMVVAFTKGDHVETGTFFGASAMIAAMCMGKGREVVTIDPMIGFYGKGKPDPITNIVPTRALVEDNFDRHPAFKKITIVEQPSHPWPKELDGREFTTALIDGDHTYEGCHADWANLNHRVTKYIIFDNVDKNNPAVVEVFRDAASVIDWRPVLLHNGLGVIERKNYDYLD